MPPVKRAKRKNMINKEEIAEDYCFVCKDGGLLLVCEFKQCLKAYHPQCIGKDPTFLETAERWTCSCHTCFICHRRSKFHCFCCPSAVCKRCIKVAEFVHVKGKKGFCNNCLKLALLIEENVDVDSDGDKIDFKDRDTYEFLFKDYWEIIKEKEVLTLEDLHSADVLLKKGENFKNGSDSDNLVEGEEDQNLISDIDCDDDKMEVRTYSLMDRSKESELLSLKASMRKVKSKKKEFIGWGSRSLIEFLASIGKDTSKPFSQFEVNDIIRVYINENKLIHPEKKKKVLCDAKLQSVFGRKSVNRNKIFDLLEAHFAENQEESEEDELSYNSEEKEDGASRTCKRQRRMSSSGRICKKEKVLEAPQSCFASITAKNIKLVYLKRSLIEDLLKNPETFDEKITGSFVRIKSDPNDYFQRNSHQLVQVTGITKTSGTGDIGTEVILQVSNIRKGIHIFMLSDDDFSEEECKDLHQRVKDGLLKKLTIVELEQKARSLHENITKHWIDRELLLLQNLIDRANEKGWRRELFEYLDRKQLLQTPSEQQRLLQEVPKVIAEEIEPEVTSLELPKDEKLINDDSPRSILPRVFDDLGGKETSSNLKIRTDAAEDYAVYHQILEKKTSKDLAQDDGDAIDDQAVKKEAGVMSDLARDEDGNEDAIDDQAVDKEAGVMSDLARHEDGNGDAIDDQAVEKEVGVMSDLARDEDENGNAIDDQAVEKEAGIGDSINMKAASEVRSDLTGDKDDNANAIDEQPFEKDIFEVFLGNSKIGDSIVMNAASEVMSDLAGDEDENGDAIGEQALETEAGIGDSINMNAASEVVMSDLAGGDEDENRDAADEQPAEKEIDIIIIDDQDEDASDATGNQILEDPDSFIWHYVDPFGDIQGPFSLLLLKQWSDGSYFPPDFKVWMTGQTQEAAILLTDVLRQVFP